MSSMMPPGPSGQQIDPQMLMQLLGGGGGMPQGGPMPQGGDQQDSPDNGDWLTNLINDTHEAMVTEKDPATVSVLGKIIDLLTTVQAKKAGSGG
jgi:hypothetical protein